MKHAEDTSDANDAERDDDKACAATSAVLSYVRQQAALETRTRLAGFAEGWEATGMEAYDDA